MGNIDYDACYAALHLKPGAGLKEVNHAWRKLSRIHHPDQHMRDPKAHKQALEKQKQINNARDVLKKWFEQHPNAVPPKSSATSGNPNSTGSSSGHRPHSGSQSAKHSQANGGPTTSSSNSHYQRSQASWQSRSQSTRSSSQRQSQSAHKAHEPTVGWFMASELRLTPLQGLARRLASEDNTCNSDQTAIMGFVLGAAAIFGPMVIIASLLRTLFPDMPTELPDWLQVLVLGSSGFCTFNLFKWFFVESEIIKLQEKVLYFKTTRSTNNAVEYLNLVIAKHTHPRSEWRAAAENGIHSAVLDYEEDIFADWREKRHIAIRFTAKPIFSGSVVAIEIRAKSPINSFSCKRIVNTIVEELKKELHELAA